MVFFKIITIVIWFILSVATWGLIKNYILNKVEEILYTRCNEIDTIKEFYTFWISIIISLLIGILIGSLN